MDSCSKCTHFKTCKYADEAIKFESKQIKDIPEFIKVEIKCKYFDENKPHIKAPLDIIDTPNTWTTTSTPNPCEDCDWYKNHLFNTVPYVGDSPCQWCSKSPYKITCTTSATVTSGTSTSKCINKVEE